MSTTTTFVYLVEGEPYVGDIADYANAIEQGHYSGLAVDHRVWVFNAFGTPVAHVAKSTSNYDENDYVHVTVSLEFRKGDPEEATIRIDGRA